MVSIRTKLFAKKNGGNSKKEETVYHDFGDLAKEKSKFPSGDKQKRITPKPKLDNKGPKETSKTPGKKKVTIEKSNGEKINLPGSESKPKRTQSTKTKTKNEDNQEIVKKLINKYKNDSDFRKKVNIGGYITLGTAVTTGAVLGGAKLIKDKKKEISNERVKRSILFDDDSQNENKD